MKNATMLKLKANAMQEGKNIAHVDRPPTGAIENTLLHIEKELYTMKLSENHEESEYYKNLVQQHAYYTGMRL